MEKATTGNQTEIVIRMNNLIGIESVLDKIQKIKKINPYAKVYIKVDLND